MIHAAFAGDSDAIAALDEEQSALLSYANQHLATLRAPYEDGEAHRELHLRWFDDAGNIILEGTADFVETHPGGLVVVADLKTGRVEVDEAADNVQVSAYGVLAKKALGATEVHVGIIQPRASKEHRLTAALYDAQGLAAAEEYILSVLEKARQPDAPLVAGEKQCRLCRAATAGCPAFAAKFGALVANPPEKKSISTLDGDHLKYLFDAIRFADRIADEVKAEVRNRIAENDPEFADWELKSTGKTKECTDLVGAFTILQDAFGIDGADFTKATKLQWGSLVDMIVSKTGMPKAKAEHQLADALAGVIEYREKKPSPKLKK